MKKRWMFATLLLGVVLALGLAGSAVLAHGRGNGESPHSGDRVAGGGVFAHLKSGDGESRLGSLASRVADILELDEQEVKDAFHRAVREMLEQKIQQKLDRGVENGKVTQEQADEYLEWFRFRPDTFAPGVLSRRFGKSGFHGGKRSHGLKCHGGKSGKRDAGEAATES